MNLLDDYDIYSFPGESLSSQNKVNKRGSQLFSKCVGTVDHFGPDISDNVNRCNGIRGYYLLTVAYK